MSIFLLAARFKFSIHRLVIGLMVAVPFSAFAAGMAKDPLSDLVSTGVNHAFAIESERLRLEIARNQQSINYANLLPTLTLNAGKTYSGVSSVNTDGSTSTQSTPASNLNITASWKIWDNFNSIRTVQKGEKVLDQEKVNTQRQVQQYILSLLTNYLSYQLLLNQCEVLKDHLAQSKITNEESQTMIRAGAKTKLDGMDTEIQVASDEQDLMDLEDQILVAERNLQVLMNDENVKKLPRLDLLTHKPYYLENFGQRLVKIRSEWKRQLDELNLDLKYSRLGLEAGQMDVDQSKLSYFPQTSLSLTHSYIFDSYLPDNTAATYGYRKMLQGDSVSLSLTWTFWDWLVTPRTIENVQKNFQTNVITYHQTKLQSQTDIENNLRKWDVLVKTTETSRLILQKAEAQLKYSQEVYRLGRINLLEMQQAQARVQTARNSLASRLKDQNILAAQLLYETGYDLTPPGVDLSWIQ